MAAIREVLEYGAPSDIQLGLATSNPNKVRQFQRDLPSGVGFQLPPLFDEEAIKDRLHLNELDGIGYASSISRLKLIEQRSRQRDSEGANSDYAILVTDSVLIAEKNGIDIAINRDGNKTVNVDEVPDLVNRNGEVSYVGSVSFGRKLGLSAFTVSTYFKAPLGERLTKWPIVNDEIPGLKDPKMPYEVGYISHRLSPNGILIPVRHPVLKTDDFNEARPYISGLTREVKEFAIDTAQMDRDTASIVEAVIAKHPFNTLGYYSVGNDLEAVAKLYEEVGEDPDAYFEKYGGNCTLFTLNIARELQGLGYDTKIVLYPAMTKSDEILASEGHSAVLVESGGRKYLFDPGLSVPFGVPVGDLPLAPFVAGDKSILIGLGGKSKSVPDLLVMKANGKVSKLEGQRSMPVVDFTRDVSRYLEDIHPVRRELKLDFHNSDGSKILGVSVDMDSRKFVIKIQNKTLGPIGLDQLSDESTFLSIKQVCDYHGVDDSFVISQLTGLSLAR